MNTSKQATLIAPVAPNWRWKPILVIAWPMILVAVVVSVAQNGQIWILGQGEGGRTLYRLSMLQPFYFLFIALLECLTITNQIFSARSMHTWSSRKVVNSTLLFGAIGSVFILVLALLSYAFESQLQPLLGGDADGLFHNTLPMYLLSLIPLLLLELCNAGLRGQGRTAASMVMISSYILLNLAVCYVAFIHFDMGFEAIVYGNVISTLLVLPVAFMLLCRQVLKGVDHDPSLFWPRLQALMLDAGVPIFLSMLVAFGSSVVMFPMLSDLNADYASGFLIVVKLRSLFIIPAVALASAVAIFVNQHIQSEPKPVLALLLKQGLGYLVVLYLLLSAVVYFVQQPLVNVLANTPNVEQAGYLLMGLLLPTFFLTSLLAASQTVLEQLGYGRQVLLITIVCECVMIVTLLASMHWQRNVNTLVAVIISFNALYLLWLLREYGRMLKRIGGQDAV
ncbi:MATE family efflux transporter [Serratia fonticola]|uniref:MATE family efflux transporter n=1 Tax=Serratia fonticola TaxID=47917 RepID=UPI0034C66A1F